MLALACAAGTLRFAIPARDVLCVLPRQTLLALPEAPASIAGMLRFRERLIPTVDLCQLVLERSAISCPASRIIILKLVHDTELDGKKRWLALIAEDVLDLVEVSHSERGLSLPNAPWLGDFARGEQSTLQWLKLDKLMPKTLRALFQTAPNIDGVVKEDAL